MSSKMSTNFDWLRVCDTLSVRSHTNIMGI